jgi:hypothetical protein
MLQQAREILSGRPRLMAVWGDWLAGWGASRTVGARPSIIARRCADARGLSADTVVGITSCGVVLNLANWAWQGALRHSGSRHGDGPVDRSPRA